MLKTIGRIGVAVDAVFEAIYRPAVLVLLCVISQQLGKLAG